MSRRLGFSDTHPRIEKRLIEGLRQMSGEEKLLRLRDLNQFLDKLAEADVRQCHPEADEREVRLRVVSRRVPADLLRRATGWDPREKGY